jgi:hypothetical protein
MDTDNITKGPKLYLRYLRHLRANWVGGRIWYLVSEIWHPDELDQLKITPQRSIPVDA